ncbi:MAG: hypothetical protein A2934_01265 [Candidatus Sungbacteria bacterium RIFCSPLOWO2_01_FULL_47_10]|uniref:DUF3105 domain-containing protein n=1 Tax=Candidatus Sungbacteria bacterium RIFCSPLOWO2_01_FULL_47_10 TaxID=1802276 RepID=A0A1G2KZY2_9BACT|nr:MAG: hypothetical protein A2934_01265 [Candidatus Sungbacteria bacterium RIFCSPLOWO2_01_FULL_47_10]
MNKIHRTKNILLIIGGSVAVIIGFAGFAKYLQYREANLPGILAAEQGKNHIEVGATHEAYSTNPPTSGPHYAEAAEWGVYKEPLPDEQLIHNLEHGGVWISYRPGISKDIIQKLESMVSIFGSKVIVTPRPENDADIALAVWGRYDTFSVSEYSDERIEEFIKLLKNKTAPEPFAP